MTSGATLVVIGSVVLAVLSTAAWIVFLVLWLGSRRRMVALRRDLALPRGGPVNTAAGVARTVVRQATRIRDHGVTQLLSNSLEGLVQWAKSDREPIVRVAAADGTVTLFFSDIADSTARNEQLGDRAWVRLLAVHDRLVRREIERQDGVVVKTIGDGFMAVFARADGAVRAAEAVHESLRDSDDPVLRSAPLLLRIGIHTGTAISSGEDYLGRNVALCARIAANAVAGTTQVSAATRYEVDDVHGWQFASEGPVAFKGIVGVVEVFTVV